jgi:P27 family predicted phage terminase small subunit
MRGRKPKPTHLRIIDGNAGHRAINHAEPQPVGDLLEAPEWMSESQRASWNYAIQHAPKGLLKNVDRSVLVAYAVAEALHAEAAQKVARFGPIIKAPITGIPMQSPYLAIVNKQAAIMMKAAAEMGLTPSSRSRVRIDATHAPSAFDDLREIDD